MFLLACRKLYRYLITSARYLASPCHLLTSPWTWAGSIKGERADSHGRFHHSRARCAGVDRGCWVPLPISLRILPRLGLHWKDSARLGSDGRGDWDCDWDGDGEETRREVPGTWESSTDTLPPFLQ